jgi:hypothetical protein
MIEYGGLAACTQSISHFHPYLILNFPFDDSGIQDEARRLN